MPRPRDPSLTGKTARLDTRVEPETRDALERSAAASGISLSREIEERLVRSLNADGARDSGREETDGLLSALRIMIKGVEDLTGQQWQTDGFTRDAVAAGAAWFVRRLGPDSDAPPATFPATFKWIWERLKVEKSNQSLASEVGRFCADATVQNMSTPIVKDHPIAPYWLSKRADERVTAGALKRLFRAPDSTEGGGNDD